MNSEVITMKVNIAGERISLSVPFSRQEAVRKTESEMAALYRTLSDKFPRKSPAQLLAMMAYKFASSYFDMVGAEQENTREAQELLDVADRIINGRPLDGDDHEGFPLY